VMPGLAPGIHVLLSSGCYRRNRTAPASPRPSTPAFVPWRLRGPDGGVARSIRNAAPCPRSPSADDLPGPVRVAAGPSGRRLGPAVDVDRLFVVAAVLAAGGLIGAGR